MAEKRLIDANVLMEHLEQCIEEGKGLSRAILVAVKCFVVQMPTVDAVEVVHGWWIIKSKEIRHFEYVAVAECSECHAETESNRSLYISGFSMDMVDGIVRREAKNMGLGNYCPNCGAMMDGERRSDG